MSPQTDSVHRRRKETGIDKIFCIELKGHRPLNPKSRAFTLLEVMIAVAILGLSLSSLLVSQADSMKATQYARMLSIAAVLAEQQLIEIEWEQRQEGWTQSDQEFSGDFTELGWPGVRYECLVDFIEIPEYNQLLEAKQDEERSMGADDQSMDAGDQAFGMLGMVWPMVKSAIESAIRKASCTVYWKDGKIEHDFDVVTFWTDPAALEQLALIGGNQGEAGATPSGSSSGLPSAAPRTSSGNQTRTPGKGGFGRGGVP